VVETVRTFADHWNGTGAIGNAGDTERLELDAGEYMISEVIDTGASTMELDQNHYAAGDNVTMEYRHGATEIACLSAAWVAYTVPWASLGYVQVRMTSTL